MSSLPDELWIGIMEAGIRGAALGYRDLCCLSIACRRLRRLSGDDVLWFERHRARKRAAWRLAVLREESQVAEHTKKLEDLRSLIDREHEKLKVASIELRNLEKVRRASVAMHVWQPEVVRSSLRQLVVQCTVPVESRVSALEMEIKLCKQQITVHSKAFRNHKQKLDERKETLASLKYHPIDDYALDVRFKNHTKRQRKIK